MEVKKIQAQGSLDMKRPFARKTRWESFVKHMTAHKWLYIFLIPGMAFFIIFDYGPMYGTLIAFKDFSVSKGIWASEWVGLAHFKYLFTSSKFFNVFRNSVWISVLRIIWGFPAPILLSLILNEIRNVKYKRTIQTIVYLPHFISWVVVAGMVINFTSIDSGVINYLIKSLGGTPVSFLQNRQYFRSVLVVSDIWKGSGWGTIIYLAAMSGINMELYESAMIDGAGRLKRIWHITLPGIRDTIIVMLILRMGSILRNGFEQIFLLYNPLVYEVADVFETYTYRVGLLEGRFSFATAVGIFQSCVGFLLIVISNKLAKKYGEGGLW